MAQYNIEERVKFLRWAGFNPIHLWGNVYLMRPMPDSLFYTIKIFKE
jgi:hypothetical protein